MKRCSIALVFLLVGGSARGQQKLDLGMITKVDTPAMAAAAAKADLERIAPHERPYIRYLWNQGGDMLDVRAAAFIANTISRATLIRRPIPLHNNHLLRIDLRWYGGTDRGLKDLTRIWEELRFDPKFNRIITKGTLRLIGVNLKSTKARVRRAKVHFEWKKYWNRATSKYEWYKDNVRLEHSYVQVPLFELEKGEVARLPSPAVDSRVWDYLQEETHSAAPVVYLPYWAIRCISTVQNSEVGKVLYGGLYYDLVGLVRNPKKGTSEDAVFESLGVGNVATGLTAAKVFDRLRSDQRVAMERSGITERPRRVDFFPHLAARIGSGYFPLVAITHDGKEGDIDVDQHPLLNLLDFKDAARELIAVKSNGLHLFALFDGKGNLQDEVPPNVAKDRHEAENSGTARLQPAIGCIRCHGLGDSGGWKAVQNDVRQAQKTGLDIFGDTSDLKSSIPTVIDRLAGLYAGDPAKALRRAREDYANAILLATGPWKGEDQTKIVALVSARVAAMWKAYKYDPVTPRQALQELGYEVKQGKEKEWLLRMIPPVRNFQAIMPEDLRLHRIKTGASINRESWDLVYSFAVGRANDSWETLPPGVRRFGPLMPKVPNNKKLQEGFFGRFPS